MTTDTTSRKRPIPYFHGNGYAPHLARADCTRAGRTNVTMLVVLDGAGAGLERAP